MEGCGSPTEGRRLPKGVEVSRYELEEVWFPFSEYILSWDEVFHDILLNDRIRMEAYRAAIERAVRPGMSVVDLGTGTGILAQWALQAGARRVYGIEMNPNVLSFAIGRIEKAGFSSQFHPLNTISYKAALPERVDIVLSEIIGNLGDNEDFVPILTDARTRFLKDSGQMIPSQVTTYLVPISSLKAHFQVKEKLCRSHYPLEVLNEKLNLSSPFNLYYDAILPREGYLGQPQCIRSFRFDGTDAATYDSETTFFVEQEGIFSGFKGYFTAQLFDDVVLDISGDDIERRKTSDSWKHSFLPIKAPIEVKEGDEISLIFSRFYPNSRTIPFRQYYRWKGAVQRNGRSVAHFYQSMDENQKE